MKLGINPRAKAVNLENRVEIFEQILFHSLAFQFGNLVQVRQLLVECDSNLWQDVVEFTISLNMYFILTNHSFWHL